MKKRKKERKREERYEIDPCDIFLEDLIAFTKENIEETESFLEEIEGKELRPLIFADDKSLTPEQKQLREKYQKILNYLKSLSQEENAKDFYNNNEMYFDIIKDLLSKTKGKIKEEKIDYLEQVLKNITLIKKIPFTTIAVIVRSRPTKNYTLNYLAPTPNTFPKGKDPYEENIFTDRLYDVVEQKDTIQVSIENPTYVIKTRRGTYYSLVAKRNFSYVNKKIDIYDLGGDFSKMPTNTRMNEEECQIPEYLSLKERKTEQQLEENEREIKHLLSTLDNILKNSHALSGGTSPKTLEEYLSSEERKQSNSKKLTR